MEIADGSSITCWSNWYFLSIHAHDDNIIDGIPSQVKKKIWLNGFRCIFLRRNRRGGVWYVFSGGQRVHKKMRQKKQGRWKGKGGRRVADGRLLGCIVIFPSLQTKKNIALEPYFVFTFFSRRMEPPSDGSSVFQHHLLVEGHKQQWKKRKCFYLLGNRRK